MVLSRNSRPPEEITTILIHLKLETHKNLNLNRNKKRFSLVQCNNSHFPRFRVNFWIELFKLASIPKGTQKFLKY